MLKHHKFVVCDDEACNEKVKVKTQSHKQMKNLKFSVAIWFDYQPFEKFINFV